MQVRRWRFYDPLFGVEPTTDDPNLVPTMPEPVTPEYKVVTTWLWTAEYTLDEHKVDPDIDFTHSAYTHSVRSETDTLPSTIRKTHSHNYVRTGLPAVRHTHTLTRRATTTLKSDPRETMVPISTTTTRTLSRELTTETVETVENPTVETVSTRNTLTTAEAWMRDWTVPINPAEMTSPFPRKNVTTRSTTAIKGNVIVIEGQPQPKDWQFSGTILSQEHYDRLKFWVDKPNYVEITDHFGRVLTVYLVEFDPTPKRSLNYYWRHDYTVTGIVMEVSTVGTF